MFESTGFSSSATSHWTLSGMSPGPKEPGFLQKGGPTVRHREKILVADGKVLKTCCTLCRNVFEHLEEIRGPTGVVLVHNGFLVVVVFSMGIHVERADSSSAGSGTRARSAS